MKNILEKILELHPQLKDSISEMQNMSDEEYRQMICDSYNLSEGNLNIDDGIDCPKCKNKGYIQFVKGVYMPVRECECMRRRKIIKRAKNSGLGDYLNKRSKDFIITDDWQQKAFDKMVAYCKHTPDNWFIACGQSGAGKTLLCSIIANHFLFNLEQEVTYITWTDFISRLKRDMMSDNSNLVNTYLDEIKNVNILFIDELLKKYNETDLKYIIEIINYRYQNNLKTIITSENTINDLLDIDEATFGRVIEKCENYVVEIGKDRSKNYRLRHI